MWTLRGLKSFNSKVLSGNICKLRWIKMSSTYVRRIQGEEKMQITVEYSPLGGTPRTFNLDRKQAEELGVALTRLKSKIEIILTRKRKKKKNAIANLASSEESVDDEYDFNIEILDGNSRKIDEKVPNFAAWTEGHTLRIADTDIPISVNIPTVKLLPLPSSIMAGFPIFPRFELEFADLQHSKFIWERNIPSPAETTVDDDTESNHENKPRRSAVIEEKSLSPIYTPTTADVGFCLKLTCIPGHNGRIGKEDTIVSDEVKPGPGLCPFETRHLYTPSRTEDGIFRVVTYNLLADTYSDTDYAQNVLFAYCPPYALDMDYRRQLLLKEITGYNADIICLQEVDRKIFENELVPYLDFLGYTGSVAIKGRQQGCEGVATFVRNSKFRIVEQQDVILTDKMINSPEHADIIAAIEKLPALKEKLSERSTVLQIMVLSTVQSPPRFICLANTHLYFHPEAGHLRLLQTAVSLHHIKSICQQYKQQGCEISIVFCGDFNSTPEKGVHKLITEKHLPANYPDWKDGGEEEWIRGLELRHDMDLMSACGYVDYSNYTPGFHGMLDYIFVDSQHLTTKQVVPMPSHEEVTLHTAIPSVVFPSDHIAQVCDLAWTDS